MHLALSPERLGVGVEAAEGAHQFAIAHAGLREPSGQGGGMGRLFGTEASEAAARVSGAKSAASGLSNRAQASEPLGDHHAYGATLFAFNADGVGRSVGLATVQVSAETFHELQCVYGATAGLEVPEAGVWGG